MEGVDGTYTRCQFMENETQCQQFYSRIVPFEGYDKILLNNVKYCCLQFDRQQSMTLDLFINAIKYKYLRVYDSQIVQIAKLVLLHFQNLQNRNIAHGNLSNENIMISLAKGSPRLVTYARPVKINKINFTNYELNPEKQKNDENIMQGIIFNLLKLVAYEKLKAYINKFEKQNTTSILKKISKDLILSDDCKIEITDIEVEESYTSSRYLKGSSYGDDLRGLPTYLQRFRQTIYQKINNDTQEFKKNIEEINKQQEKDKNQSAIIQDIEMIEAPTKINIYHEEFNQFLMDQFMQNIHEFAINKTMKDIGEHLENASFLSSTSFKTSQDAIQLHFTIQEQTFVNIFQQCQNLRKDFMIIFMDINEKKQQQFKVNIQLSLEQSYLSLIDDLYYFIISQDKLKSENILLDTGSKEFKQQWGTKMRNIIEDIYEEYFSLEMLKLIESLI